MNQAMEAVQDGEWVWVPYPTPEQETAFVAGRHAIRDASLRCAKRLSKLAVRYAAGAATDTDPKRAARWISEARRLRVRAWSYLNDARRNDI